MCRWADYSIFGRGGDRDAAHAAARADGGNRKTPNGTLSAAAAATSRMGWVQRVENEAEAVAPDKVRPTGVWRGGSRVGTGRKEGPRQAILKSKLRDSVVKIVLQHGVIPGSSHTQALGISSPGTYEAILMWSRSDGERQWNTMLDWTCR